MPPYGKIAPVPVRTDAHMRPFETIGIDCSSSVRSRRADVGIGPYGFGRDTKCVVMGRPVRTPVEAIRFPYQKERIPAPVTSVTGSE